ncbi:MAG: hypothetical protein CVV56_01175 [Tenericutes bacterium HGW-Tenericutes-1]|jgi:hypothetical protein|nr:MAG: hypothetical protein CVV56_01175 [Tenericutes bacterium HGW-Tenericutes-1]
MPNETCDIYNLIKISLLNKDYLNAYLSYKKDLGDIFPLNTLSSLLFSTLGECTVNFQVLEMVLNGMLVIDEFIEINGEETTKNILDDNLEKILIDIENDNFSIDKEYSRLTRMIEKLKDRSVIDTEIYSLLIEVKDIRNEIIHSSVIRHPNIIVKIPDMKKYIVTIKYHSLFCNQTCKNLFENFIDIYSIKYPSIATQLQDLLIKMSSFFR